MLSFHLSKQPAIVSYFARLLMCGTFASTMATSGLTWLELMFFSIAMADNTWALLHSATAQAHKTIARQLWEFATAATVTFKFALDDDAQQHLLATPKTQICWQPMDIKKGSLTRARILPSAARPNHSCISSCCLSNKHSRGISEQPWHQAPYN